MNCATCLKSLEATSVLLIVQGVEYVFCRLGCLKSWTKKLSVRAARVASTEKPKRKSWWDTASPEQRAARSARMRQGQAAWNAKRRAA